MSFYSSFLSFWRPHHSAWHTNSLKESQKTVKSFKTCHRVAYVTNLAEGIENLWSFFFQSHNGCYAFSEVSNPSCFVNWCQKLAWGKPQKSVHMCLCMALSLRKHRFGCQSKDCSIWNGSLSWHAPLWCSARRNVLQISFLSRISLCCSLCANNLVGEMRAGEIMVSGDSLGG